jgi:hypothetical protein
MRSDVMAQLKSSVSVQVRLGGGGSIRRRELLASSFVTTRITLTVSQALLLLWREMTSSSDGYHERESLLIFCGTYRRYCE